jgi:hypothetical protein
VTPHDKKDTSHDKIKNSYNGLSRAEVADTMILISRSCILVEAAAWHAYGKSHPQEEETAETEADAIISRHKRVIHVLQTAPPLPTSGTPSILLGEHFTPTAASYVNPLDATRQAYEYHWRKTDAHTKAGRNLKLQMSLDIRRERTRTRSSPT